MTTPNPTLYILHPDNTYSVYEPDLFRERDELRAENERLTVERDMGLTIIEWAREYVKSGLSADLRRRLDEYDDVLKNLHAKRAWQR